MAKWVYMFTEGNANMRNLLGGKGANLASRQVIFHIYPSFSSRSDGYAIPYTV